MCPGHTRGRAPEKVRGSARLPAPRCRGEDIVTGDAQGPAGTARAVPVLRGWWVLCRGQKERDSQVPLRAARARCPSGPRLCRLAVHGSAGRCHCSWCWDAMEIYTGWATSGFAFIDQKQNSLTKKMKERK